MGAEMVSFRFRERRGRGAPMGLCDMREKGCLVGAYCSISPSWRTLGFMDAMAAVGILLQYLAGVGGLQGTG